MVTKKAPKSFRNKVPHRVIRIIKVLRSMGHEAYVVGGAVRDLYLGETPKDWDVATSATGEEINSVRVRSEYPFQIRRVGRSFPVFLIDCVEVATFRIDGDYSDHRHPDSVETTRSLEEDLKRRDFTINALAYDPILDVVRGGEGSFEDMKARLIAPVGDAEERFEEDPLRVFRAFRLVAEHPKLKMTAAVTVHIQRCLDKDILSKIPAERVRDEFVRILEGDTRVLRDGLFIECLGFWLGFHGLLSCFCFSSSQNNAHHVHSLWEHTCLAVQYADTPVQKLVAFFHDLGKFKVCWQDPVTWEWHYYGKEKGYPGHAEVSAGITREVMEKLKFPKVTTDLVVRTVKHHQKDLIRNPSPKKLRRAANRWGKDVFHEVVKFGFVDWLASGTVDLPTIIDYKAKVYLMVNYEVLQRPVGLVDLALDGNDIMSILGIEPGPKVGEVKNRLMEMVLDDPDLNNRNTLIAYLESIEE